MAAATARAPAADKRWGFAAAAAAAAAPTRTPAVGALGTAPKPANSPTQRGASPWGDKPVPPAPNAWGSSSLLSLKNDGGSGSFGNINDRPSSRGSSGTSTDGSDLLDSPLAWRQASHNSTTVISHPQNTGLTSGSRQFPYSNTSFSDVLKVKAPLKTFTRRGPTSHGKGFTLSADDFPVLVSMNSQSNSQLGHSFQGRPTFSSVIIASRDEQRKILTTAVGDPVSTTNFPTEAQQAQLQATQTPDICMPPPCIDYWHPPPDHPPDRNGIWQGGGASYDLCKPADTPSSLPVESFTHNGQSLLNQGVEARHGPVHGGYHLDNSDSSYAHVPGDACVKTLPHHMVGKVKDNHSGALEKQVIKKDPVLLEKIRCLNIKARKLRASKMSEISSCRESKVEHPKSIDVEGGHVSNDFPVSAVISDITSAFGMAISASESSNHVLNGTSNMSANFVMIDLSEEHATKFSEARRPEKSVDNHVCGVGNTSRNKRGSSAMDTASDIWGPGWEEHSTVDSLPVAMTNTHEDQPFAGNSSQQMHVRTADDMLNSPDFEIQNSVRELSAQHAKQLREEEKGEIGRKAKSIVKLEDLQRHPFVQSQNSNDTPGKSADYLAYRGGNASRNRHGSFAEDISSSVYGHGWEDNPAVVSFSAMTNTHQDLSFSWNTSRQVHVRTADDIINSPVYETQHSGRQLSAQHAKQPQEEEMGKAQQKAKSIAILEDLNMRPLVKSQNTNDAPGKSADSHEYGGLNASRSKPGDSTQNFSLNNSGHGWEDHPAVDLPVMTNSYQDQSVLWDTSQQVHHSRWRESSAQHAKELQKERANIQQKATSIAKPENLNRRPFVRSQKSNDAPGRYADYHEYGGWHASRNRQGSSAEDSSFNMPGHRWVDRPAENMNKRPFVHSQKTNDALGRSADYHEYGGWHTSKNRHGSSAEVLPRHGWEDHPTVDSLPIMTNTHQEQSFPENTSRQMHVRTADRLNSPDYEIQHSRRELSAQHAKRVLEQENGKVQQKVKSEDLNRDRFVQSQMSDEAPGKSSDYHVYGKENTSRNRHGSSSEDMPFRISGVGWDDHPTVDSLPAMTNSHQDQPFLGRSAEQVHEKTIDDMLNSPDYETQLSGRKLSAQHARQLQKEEWGKLQPKAKANAKMEEFNRSSFLQNQKSSDVPLEADKIPCKQSSGGNGTTNHDTSTSNTCTAENLNGPLRANGTENTAVPISSTPASGTASFNRGPLTRNAMPPAKKTDINMLEHTAQRSGAESHVSSASKHLQVRDREGQVHKQQNISRVSTSGTADANEGPLVHNAIPLATNTDINMIHIDQKGASESHVGTVPTHLRMEDKRRQVQSQGRISRGSPASESAGVNKGSLIHNVMPSAKNNDIDMMEHIARKSALQSHENSAPKHLQMETRRRQVRSHEGVLRERSNIAESTENITTVAGTRVDTWHAEAKPLADLSTQSKNRGPASPLVCGTKNTEASSVHKVHMSGVVINSAIIPAHVSSIRGFTVGSIILGDASLASVNQEEKTVSKEVHDDVTNSCASPNQTKQSGMNRHGVHHVKDSSGSDGIMHTPVEGSSKKEQSEAGGSNCTAIPAPIQSSGNQSIASLNVAPTKTSEMERHGHKPVLKDLDLKNPRQMLPAEKHTKSSDNSSKSKSDTKTLDKEALDAPTATKVEVEAEPENREGEKARKHLGRSRAASDQGSMNSSASAAPRLNEQEANSLVSKVTQELSGQLEQAEKQLKPSNHAASVNCTQPTQMVSLPGYTCGEHHASHSQRQYYVDGQGNMWMSYAANSHMDGRVMTQRAAMGTTHLLPGPVSIPVPENNLPGVNIGPAPGWTWDVANGVLISDVGDASGLGSARTARSGDAPTNAYRVSQMDLMLDAQAAGGMALYHTGAELEQLNPAWFPHVQHQGIHGGSGGTGMYLMGMDGGAGAQAHGGAASYMAGPMVGPVQHPDYQLMAPAVASSVAAWSDGGSAMLPTGHPAEAWEAAYGEYLYYV
ncbi:unnamed protein product [Urochloa decumbens]|uniref:Uncharacterized protein n=1 Tax=Urochloa decumbens TaxID=240449 RepID=A0ABC9AQK0_9POAL